MTKEQKRTLYDAALDVIHAVLNKRYECQLPRSERYSAAFDTVDDYYNYTAELDTLKYCCQDLLRVKLCMRLTPGTAYPHEQRFLTEYRNKYLPNYTRAEHIAI